MPEYDPHTGGIAFGFHRAGIPQITRINGRKKAQEAQNKNKKEIMAAKRRKIRKNGKSLYRGKYVEPDKISATEPDKMHKVIYCAATRE
ncbi:MAG: hypothetical protein DRH24_18125 [Deltaproteobacteria bacterium]|nr:MAG: hypothetical protein DRH24_18125 [Deltaproteobacteria bacterium]